MRLLRPLLFVVAVLASGSVFAQRSSESDQSQGIRNGNLAFTRQTQNRGFFAVPGFFAPGLTNGKVGSRHYRASRFTGGPALYNTPGSLDTTVRQRAYYNEPSAYRNRDWR
jgi:hypothetical protein